MEKEELTVRPDPARIVEGLRDTGYDFNTAIADIVDNSIAADATKINILVNMDPSEKVTVYIADNGCGMDHDDLINAMRYGSEERENLASLGKFGLGLKTASTAFCRCLSVTSRGKGAIVEKAQWDLDHIAETGEWNLRQPDITDDELEFLEGITEGGSGTLVVWGKVDRLIPEGKPGPQKSAYKRIIRSLKFHLSMVYQRFLDQSDDRAPNISIKLNEQFVEPWDPFCEAESSTACLCEEDLEIEMVGVSEIPTLHIRAMLIPRKDEFSSEEAEKDARLSNSMQGFYVYRENRLIHHGDWMGMFANEPHGTLLRVELSFDHYLDEVFRVDIKKSRILLNEDIFTYIKDQVMPGPRHAADERYRMGTKKKVQDASTGAHDASNANIESKAKSAEESKVEVKDEMTGDAEVTNAQGTFSHRIKIHHPDKPEHCRIIPVDTLDGSVLWEPTIADGKKAVAINTGHPYYQKVYYPVLDQNVMVTGMDALLWALAEAELATFNENTREQYEEMRVSVARILRKLVADLPEPKMDEG